MAKKNEHAEADRYLIETLKLNKDMSYGEVRKKIYAYIKKNYRDRVSSAMIKAHTDDFTESICLRLNINQE